MDGVPVAPTLRHRVAQEVLGCRHDACAQVIRLQAADIGRSDRPAENGVLAVRLLDAAPPRVTRDVEHGRQPEPGAHGQHLLANNSGDLLDEIGIPGRGQPKSLGKDGRVALAQAAHGLLMDEDRNAQPRAFDGHTLDGVHQLGAFCGPQASGCSDAGHLADAMRHL